MQNPGARRVAVNLYIVILHLLEQLSQPVRMCRLIINDERLFGFFSESYKILLIEFSCYFRLAYCNTFYVVVFNMIDTPGIATKIDFEDFVKKGMKKKDAKQRAKEATKGVIESIKWLDNMDVVLVVMDSARNPLDQVNVTILGNLEARGIPVLIVANKLDMKKANAHTIRTAFPQYATVGISAKTGHNIKGLYESLFSII